MRMGWMRILPTGKNVDQAGKNLIPQAVQFNPSSGVTLIPLNTSIFNSARVYI